MHLHRILFCACLCAGLAQAHAADVPQMKLPPVDEAAGDRSWIDFKNRLLNALEKRDRKFVLSVIDRNVRNSPDTPRGVTEFRKQWGFDADDTPLWRELLSALFLGGAYVKRDKGPTEFCAPYVMPKWPDNVDPHDHGVIITRDVLVKAAPSSGSGTLQTLTYDIVAVTDWEVADQASDVGQRWVKIRIGAGEGYVPEEQIRSPIEHTACFAKTADGWRMTALGAGGI